MELVDYLINGILESPQIVRWPGIFLIALFLLRAVGQFFRLRLISVAINILYALIIGLVVARYGQEIADFIVSVGTQQSTGPTQTNN